MHSGITTELTGAAPCSQASIRDSLRGLRSNDLLDASCCTSRAVALKRPPRSCFLPVVSSNLPGSSVRARLGAAVIYHTHPSQRLTVGMTRRARSTDRTLRNSRRALASIPLLGCVFGKRNNLGLLVLIVAQHTEKTSTTNRNKVILDEQPQPFQILP
jgi:hypothetical protein